VLEGWQGENPRFRIEHCSLVNESLLQRIKELALCLHLFTRTRITTVTNGVITEKK
jgi:predicted amidohydrolase YtcJ